MNGRSNGCCVKWCHAWLASPFSGTVGGPPKRVQCFLALDPSGFSGSAFNERNNELTKAIISQEGARLPGARRFGNRKSIDKEGIYISDSLLEKINRYCT